MLCDFNSWWRIAGEDIIDVADAVYESAVRQCYQAICWNRYKNGTFFCPLNIDDIGVIIIGYVSMFTKQEVVESDPKYIETGGRYYGYYDEVEDRKNSQEGSYRSSLIRVLSKGCMKDEGLVDEVLSYMYWHSTSKIVKSSTAESSAEYGQIPLMLLRPAGVDRFKESDWYMNEPWTTLFDVGSAISGSILDFIKTAGDVVAGAIDDAGAAISNVFSFAGWFAKNWLYVLGGGALLFIGGQIYFKSRTGKYVGEDIARSVIKFKTGLGDDGSCDDYHIFGIHFAPPPRNCIEAKRLEWESVSNFFQKDCQEYGVAPMPVSEFKAYVKLIKGIYLIVDKNYNLVRTETLTYNGDGEIVLFSGGITKLTDKIAAAYYTHILLPKFRRPKLGDDGGRDFVFYCNGVDKKWTPKKYWNAKKEEIKRLQIFFTGGSIKYGVEPLSAFEFQEYFRNYHSVFVKTYNNNIKRLSHVSLWYGGPYRKRGIRTPVSVERKMKRLARAYYTHIFLPELISEEEGRLFDGRNRSRLLTRKRVS